MKLIVVDLPNSKEDVNFSDSEDVDSNDEFNISAPIDSSKNDSPPYPKLPNVYSPGMLEGATSHMQQSCRTPLSRLSTQINQLTGTTQTINSTGTFPWSTASELK